MPDEEAGNLANTLPPVPKPIPIKQHTILPSRITVDGPIIVEESAKTIIHWTQIFEVFEKELNIISHQLEETFGKLGQTDFKMPSNKKTKPEQHVPISGGKSLTKHLFAR